MSTDPANPNPAASARRVFVSAGEASGDAHAARLLRALPPEIRATTRFFGIGGDALRAAGCDTSVADARDMAVVGLWEPLVRLPHFIRIYRRALRALDATPPPAALLTVDYPGFNLRLARAAHRRGIPVCHYICPQVWAWNRSRIPKIARIVDLLMVFFPFEVGVFRDTPLRPVFVGHPLVESIARTLAQPPPDLPWPGPAASRVAILPGSRAAELRRILPAMLDAAEALLARRPDATFLVAAATDRDATAVRTALARRPAALQAATAVAVGCMRDVVRTARCAMVCSGTATVETALLHCPHILVYKTSPFTYLAGRLVIRIPWLGMVNIIANRTVCPEFIQRDARPAPMADALLALLDDTPARAAQLAALSEVASSLAAPSTSSPAQTFAAFLSSL
jgi:lipid-A-disaccharide synthase